MSDKERKGQYLLGELNYIDDDLLYEAVSLYPAARKKRKSNRIIALICAAAAAAMLLAPISTAGTLLALSSFISIGNDKQNNQPPPEQTVQQFYRQEIDADLFFSGQPTIIRQEANEEIYLVTVIDESTLAAINEMAKNSSQRENDAPSGASKIWICDGNGLVTSPYLENAPGNVYYATLFDYDPELVLTEELERRLEELTS